MLPPSPLPVSALYDPAPVSSPTYLMLKEEAWPAADGNLVIWLWLSSGLEQEVEVLQHGGNIPRERSQAWALEGGSHRRLAGL